MINVDARKANSSTRRQYRLESLESAGRVLPTRTWTKRTTAMGSASRNLKRATKGSNSPCLVWRLRIGVATAQKGLTKTVSTTNRRVVEVSRSVLLDKNWAGK
jgi:hypothetical protein